MNNVSVFNAARDVWLRFGRVLGYVNARIILTGIFFLMIVPIGFALKAFGRDPLRKRPAPKNATYWEPCDSNFASLDFRRQF